MAGRPQGVHHQVKLIELSSAGVVVTGGADLSRLIKPQPQHGQQVHDDDGDVEDTDPHAYLDTVATRAEL